MKAYQTFCLDSVSKWHTIINFLTPPAYRKINTRNLAKLGNKGIGKCAKYAQYYLGAKFRHFYSVSNVEFECTPDWRENI